MASTEVGITFNATDGFVAITDGTSHSTSVTNAVATDWVNIGALTHVSIQVTNGATNSFTATVQGSNDASTWTTVAYGQGSSAAYTQSSFTAAGSATTMLFLPPSDHMRYVRLNVSAANSNGTTLTLHGKRVGR